MEYLREAVVKIIEHFNAENHAREPVIAPFWNSRERLKEYLRKEFFDRFRRDSFVEWDEKSKMGQSYSSEEPTRPRTGSFISVVQAELLHDLETYEGFRFRVHKDGSIDDPKDLIGRCLRALTSLGYREIENSAE